MRSVVNDVPSSVHLCVSVFGHNRAPYKHDRDAFVDVDSNGTEGTTCSVRARISIGNGHLRKMTKSTVA